MELKKNIPQPYINEVLGLINDRQPKLLDELRAKFNDHKEIIQLGQTLGEVGNISVNEIMVRAEVCMSGLKVVLSTCDSNLPLLKQRLKNLGSIQVISQVIVALSGATLLTQNQTAHPQVKIIVGFLALSGSILTVFAQHKSGTILSNSQSIFSIYDKLVDNKFEAELLRQEIEIEIKIANEENPDKLITIISDANKICLEIRKMLEKI
jgi:hypothetical protein